MDASGDTHPVNGEDADAQAFDLQMLDPKRIRVFRAGGITRMTLLDTRSWIRVTVARAFPLSDADHYVGLLDGAGKDIGMIYDPSQLDHESRRVVAEDLDRRYFVPVVERVLNVKEEFGTIYWTVETDRGEKEVVVRNMRDSLHEISPSRVIITDVDGNRFEFPDIQKLDTRSQYVIMRHM